MNRYDTVLDDLSRALAAAGSGTAYYLGDHKRRFASDLRTIERYYTGGEILDVGSFPHHLTYCLHRLGYPTVGVDLKPDRASAFIAANGLHVVGCDLERDRLPFPDARFGFVVFSEVLEHLRIDPIAALLEIHRVLKAASPLLLTTPNLYSMRNVASFVRGRGMMGGAYREFEKLRTVGHMGHVREYAPREVEEFLGNTGFEIVERRREAHSRSQSGRFVDVCYAMLPVFRPYQVFVARKRRCD
jgi:SAM-dependent methyltransferase